MPSRQEDYLDNLLKDLNQEEKTEEQVDELEGEIDSLLANDSIPDIDIPEDLLSGEGIEIPEDLLSGEGIEIPEDLLSGEGIEIPEDILAVLDEEVEDLTVEDIEVPETSYLDDVSEMSQEQIESLLAESVRQDDSAGAEEAISDSLEDILADSDDSDLQEIQDLLEKSENNVPVDEGVAALLYGLSEGEGPADKLLADIEESGVEVALSDKEKRAMEKERKRQEKEAKRSAKKSAKDEAKNAKSEAKVKRSKKTKAAKEEDNADSGLETMKNTGEETGGLDIDTDLLDSIVSGAGLVGNEQSSDVDGIDIAAMFGIDSGQADNGEDVLSSLTADDSSEIELSSLFGDLGDSNELFGVEEQATESEKKEKGGKARKNGVAESGTTEGKPNLLTRIINFLMEEDEEEGNENIRLSGENKEILDELDKKGKKKVKGKKGKGKQADEPDKKSAKGKGEDEEKDEKSKKKSKPKREKKIRPDKVISVEEYLRPGQKLTFKKVFPVILLGITIGAVLFIVAGVSTDSSDKRAAKEAFYKQDYETCYQNLFGKELDETEAVMYGTSESILYIRLWYNEYMMFAENGQMVEALDSLIQTVHDYPMLSEYAAKWNATGEIYGVYAEILNILSSHYGLSEAQAAEIAKVKSDEEYTRIVTAIANGEKYGNWGPTEGGQPEKDTLPDELPEESGMQQGDFVDNRK